MKTDGGAKSVGVIGVDVGWDRNLNVGARRWLKRGRAWRQFGLQLPQHRRRPTRCDEALNNRIAGGSSHLTRDLDTWTSAAAHAPFLGVHQQLDQHLTLIVKFQASIDLRFVTPRFVYQHITGSLRPAEEALREWRDQD